MAKAAGLVSHGRRDEMYALYMGVIEPSCAYWIPLKDWKEETVYIEASGVDYVALVPGCEDPVRWYDRFPSVGGCTRRTS